MRSRRLDEYSREPKYPLFLWLRLVVGERLLKLHRHHLGTQMRDAGLEVSLYRGACRRPPRRRWRPSCWASTPRPPRRPCGPNGCCGFRRRSTPSTRWTARSCPCGISRR